jgi:transcriptional regulator with XRE-family HTH domain
MASRLSLWLTEQMRNRRLGRNALARRSGVSNATITRIVRYNHIPSPDIIFVLADFFGADRDTVLEIAGLVQLSDLPADLPAEIRDLARRLYRLSPADRQGILRYFDQALQLVEERAARRGA